MEDQAIRDDGDLRKYRTELPNMVDDEMDPYQYRLYGHYKRVCGANGGECYESVRTTAEKTKMSNEKVISTRQWLADNGWIALDTGTKGTYRIAIIDRWEENFTRYFKQKTVRNPEQSTRIPLEIPNNTVRNSERAPLEISKQRKNLIKKEPNKKSSHVDPPKPDKDSDRDGRRILALVENSGIIYTEKDKRRIASELEEKYADTDIDVAFNKMVAEHVRQTKTGGRGIMAPLSYMATILKEVETSKPKKSVPQKVTIINSFTGQREERILT